MPRNNRKPHIVCRRCKTRFTGAYCPYCGAENGSARASLTRGGIIGGLLRFLFSLLVLVLLLTIAFIAFAFLINSENVLPLTDRPADPRMLVAQREFYRIILQVAYRVDMPSYAVKLLSAVIVVTALSIPLLRRVIAERRAEREEESA